jgi:hypothetical protein
MPFKKVGPDRYVSPSGRKFNTAQVKLYYATDGFKNMASTQPISKSKRKSK